MCEQPGEPFDVVRVGLIGCGTVGGAFVRALTARQSAIAERYGVWLELVEVAVARPGRSRPVCADVRVHGNAAAIADNSGIDIVVEASTAPVTSVARWLTSALARGAGVVMASKAALAHNSQLLRALLIPDSSLWCEAAVGGAVPIVRGLRDSLAGTAIRAIRGVLNGTTTYVLDQLEQGTSFDDAVRAAQSEGYAEADPTADLTGADAAAKLAILSTLAWGRPILADEVITRELTPATLAQFDDQRGRHGWGLRVRQVASAALSESTGRVRAFVAPTVLKPDDALFATHDVDNAVQIETETTGALTWHGPGAGGAATALALLGDTIAAARRHIGHAHLAGPAYAAAAISPRA